MIRPAIVLALLLSSAVMMRGVASDWKKGPPSPAESAAKKVASTGEAAPLPQAKALQPVVPGVLPDLKDGYLFNPERMLAGAEPPPPVEGEDKEVDAESTTGLNASMDDVIYAGSIIADNFTRAIIVYTEADKSKPAAQPTSRSSKSKPAPAKAPAGGEKHAQLEIGDVLDGYEVMEIQPDKLVFSKDEETIEKLLYDPEKKRQAPPPRAAAVPPGGAGLPRAAGIQSTTIGGAAAPVVPPAPGGATPPTPPPVTGNLPTPPVPALPPASKSPTTTTSPATAGASTAAGASPTPVRRMVISRQPSTAARPDTSRVIRQSQGGTEDQAPPLPPAMAGNPDDATATPPMPAGH